MSMLTKLELNHLKDSLAKKHGYNTFEEFYWQSNGLSTQGIIDEVAKHCYSEGLRDGIQGNEIKHQELKPKY